MFDKENVLTEHLVSLFPQIHIQKQNNIGVRMKKIHHNVLKGHRLWRPKHKMFIISASSLFF